MSQKLTERQQLALALKESAVPAGLEDSDREDEEAPRKPPAKKQKRKDKDSDEDEDAASGGEAEVDEDDDDEDESAAPGMVSDAAAAKRWWEGSAGFDFTTARSKSVIEEDGMRVAGDPRSFVGKLVKRSFGRGVVSATEWGCKRGLFPRKCLLLLDRPSVHPRTPPPTHHLPPHPMCGSAIKGEFRQGGGVVSARGRRRRRALPRAPRRRGRRRPRPR